MTTTYYVLDESLVVAGPFPSVVEADAARTKATDLIVPEEGGKWRAMNDAEKEDYRRIACSSR